MTPKEIAIFLLSIFKSNDVFVIALDGRSCSGKSNTAKELAKICKCNVFKIDDFCRRPPVKQVGAQNNPSSHIDTKRFISEVLKPLSKHKNIFYRSFNPHTGEFAQTVKISPKRINLIEGSYAAMPEFLPYINAHIFLNISKRIQKIRLDKRENKEKLKIFKKIWLPKEEQYFKQVNLPKKANIILNVN